MLDVHEESAIVDIPVHALIVVHPDEVYGDPLCAKPARPAHTMQVGLRIPWEIVVNDQVYLLNIDPSAKQVSGHKYLRAVFLEEIIVDNPLLLA